MKRFCQSNLRFFRAAFFSVALFAVSAFAQTSAFTYQGKLTDGANQSPTGSYKMKFALFASANGNDQTGATLTFDGAGGNSAPVQVSSGIFTVRLDFGADVFASGADRFLEISVFNPATSGFVTLSPRQQLASSPFSVRTLSAATADAAANADKLDGIDSSGFVQTNSSGFIRNQIAPQAADFNISGGGTIGGNLQVGGTITGTLGQSATTVYGTGELLVTNATSSFTLVPGLAQTVNVAPGSVLMISTDGGVRNTGTAANTFAAVFIAIFIDGTPVSPAGQRFIIAANTAGVFSGMTANWSLGVTKELAPGDHTIQVRAIFGNTFASNARVSSNGSNPELQGQLTVAVIKK